MKGKHMCRCERPQWLDSGPGAGTMSTVSQCTECKDIYFGYANEAEWACRLWKKFFAELAKIGITRHGAQHQLWQQYKEPIKGGVLILDNLAPYAQKFRDDLQDINSSCV